MEIFEKGYWPLILMLVNLLWTALNARTQSGMIEQIRKEFPTRTECALHHEICDAHHAEACRRLDALETR
jgi:hypothetical protein